MTKETSATACVGQSGHARLADALRALVSLTASSELDDASADRAAKMLEDMFATISADASTRVAEHRYEAGYPRGFLERSTVSGVLNPIAPPMKLTQDEVVVGEVVYGAAYEGAPGCVHGGHVALAFDHVAGRVASRIGPVLTGKLAVRYLKPTRLHRTIRYEARLERAHHRLVTVKCAAYDGATRTATAEIMFIELSPAYMAEVLGAA